jgi:hypothetical protein
MRIKQSFNVTNHFLSKTCLSSQKQLQCPVRFCGALSSLVSTVIIYYTRTYNVLMPILLRIIIIIIIPIWRNIRTALNGKTQLQMSDFKAYPLIGTK